MTDSCLIGHLGPRPACAGVLSRHVRGKRAAKTAWILLNFQSYVKYHIKVFLRLSKKKMFPPPLAAALPRATAPSAHRPPTDPSSIVRFRFHYRQKETPWLTPAAVTLMPLQCTRSHVQSRMRERLETLTEAVQTARLRGTNSDDNKKRSSQGTSR